MKVAIAGKGGVGKTTLTGLLARQMAVEGYRVLAIDADPDANLASALPLDDDHRVVPLAARADLIDALSGRGGLPGGMIMLNPDIGAVLPEVRQCWAGSNFLLTLGWHKGGGAGCYCAENAVLKRVLATVIPQATDAVLVDSEAGLEHLSRGTAAAVDAVLAVVQPGSRSVETAFAIRDLASGLGIRRVFPVLVGERNDADAASVQRALGANWPLLARLPWVDEIRQADLNGRLPEIPRIYRSELRRLILTLATSCPFGPPS